MVVFFVGRGLDIICCWQTSWLFLSDQNITCKLLTAKQIITNIPGISSLWLLVQMHKGFSSGLLALHCLCVHNNASLCKWCCV